MAEHSGGCARGGRAARTRMGRGRGGPGVALQDVAAAAGRPFPDLGTAFRPKNGQAYFDGLK